MRKQIYISLSEEQIEFIKEQSKNFNLSKFVDGKLNEYMKFVKELK